MNATAFEAAGHAITWAGVIGAFAVLQFVVFVAISMIAPPKKPKKGPAPADRRLIFSSAALAVLAFVAFDGVALVHFTSSTKTAAAATTAGATRATCASVQPDMTSAQVEARMGKPDEIRANDEVRGPGSTLWIYRDARCAVALFDDKVELTE